MNSTVMAAQGLVKFKFHEKEKKPKKSPFEIPTLQTTTRFLDFLMKDLFFLKIYRVFT